MTKSQLLWTIESGLRIGISYASLRYWFFLKLNVFLSIVALTSLWLSGYVFSGNHPGLSLVLNIVGSVSLIADVILNVKGSVGYWSSMYEGYNSMLSEYTRVRNTASIPELSALYSRVLDFDGKCKSVMNALVVLARNEACVQMGKPECKAKIHPFKSFTANFFKW